MSDKELIARGAEVVTGDLIMNRKVMGHYRSGQFILTPEGVDELNNVVDVVAKEPAPAKPQKATKALKNAPAADADADDERLPDSIADLLKD
jgi:hypothetical protein